MIGKLGNRVFRKLDTLSIAEANALFANSLWIAKLVKRIYSIEPKICYPGIDEELFKHAAQVDPSIESRKPFILSTSRHYPQKRLDWLIDMMPTILSRCPSASLVMTGKFTNYTTRLSKLCEGHGVEGRVVFIGEVDEETLIQLYTAANVCAYPAPEEDFGLGPLEAGACGTPSIVWDYAGLSETVVDGVTGYRAKPYDLNDFAEKVSRVLLDDALGKVLGLNAESYVKREFTWKKHVDELESALYSIT